MEIEIRAKVDNLQKMKKKLEDIGASFEEEKKQIDYIFKRKGEEKKDQGPGDFILRIRDSNKNILTFKALTDTAGVWEEHQTVIDDTKEMRIILERIGFVCCLTMIKKRIKGNLGDFEVCLDDVEGLGPHIEVELESDNKEKAKKMIMDLLGKLGIDEKNVEHKGYVALLFERQGVKYRGTG